LGTRPISPADPLRKGVAVPTIRSALTLLIAVGLPAWAQTLIRPPPEKCFASSSATYRIGSASDRPGTTVRVASDLPDPDLTMRVTDSPETADFILVDDPDGGGPGCAGSSLPTRTIRLGDGGLRPDVTVALALARSGTRADGDPETVADGEASAGAPPTDFRIYVRSTAFTVEEAAALFAVMARDSGDHAAAPP